MSSTVSVAEQNASHYNALGANYIADDGYEAKYHRKRLATASKLITKHVAAGRLFDFGCGSGDLFGYLSGFTFQGCDISSELARLCRERTGVDVAVGGIEVFEAEAGPFDAVVALNVLPYLTESDERRFYEHAAKVLSPSGCLLISHTNMLFDLVSYNRYTVDFFANEILPRIGLADEPAVMDALKAMFTNADKPLASGTTGPMSQTSDREALPKRRVDPFTYPDAVAAHGLRLKALVPLNTYALPPIVTHAHPALEAAQPDWCDRVPSSIAVLLSTQFQALFVKSGYPG